MAQTPIYLASNQTMRLSGIGEATWGMTLSDIRSKIDSELSDNAEIDKITLYFYGKSYNNNILSAKNEYVHCALTNSDSEAASNNDGGSGNCTNLIKYGPYEISGRSTTTIPDQTADITKYFGTAAPHNVQNTSYSRLTVAFTSKNIYNKDETFSVALLITYYTKINATVIAQPSEGGTVSAIGGLLGYNNTRLMAYPNSGYKFVGWYDKDGVFISNEDYCIVDPTEENVTYTAVFEKDKINKIYIGTSQPKEIYFGTQKVKEVYFGTTKVYG